ncbi:SseB family protein [Brachybacterium sp. Z12]|uniref:SseB family protein n=1 Tax=Brachybacterium sp. Z12 TaxID=2759167 RepID=UPI00223BFFF8|nr:SseB family protein [Brachybacterium sp. Z12]
MRSSARPCTRRRSRWTRRSTSQAARDLGERPDPRPVLPGGRVGRRALLGGAGPPDPARPFPGEIPADRHRRSVLGGARLQRQPLPGDDGSVPAELAAALSAHSSGLDPDREHLVAALAAARVLVPIMAVATETGTTAHGLTGDNGADMAMVSITAPDGTTVLPLFTSVAALSAWRNDARPVPVVAPQAAQAAVQEGCTALLLDPATPSEEGGPILLPRSVLWALAQGRTWIPRTAIPRSWRCSTGSQRSLPPR